MKSGMSRRKLKRCAPYLILGGLTLFFCWFFCGKGNVFGSKVDWISQHSVLPDYFRQQFYDTGSLFPEFAANIGGGQNIYNFAYYGLYSPVILLSYLLPFVEMGDYMAAASVCSLMAAVMLFFKWLLKRGVSEKTAFLTATLFLLSGPMIYHSYNQLMFVNYMPFLCMALLGADRFFERKKAGLYTIGVFLMIMTSFYFSIGGLLVLMLYGIYRYCQMKDEAGERITVLSFFGDGIRFVLPMLNAVLLSAVLLVPTAMALTGGRGAKEQVNLWKLLLPDIRVFRFVYDPYGIGLTTIVITALITGFTYRKYYEKLIHIGCVVILTFPVFAYLLNGGLYIRDKVMIPFLPLCCYLIACYIEKHRKREISFVAGGIPFLVTVLLVYLGREQAEYETYQKFLLAEGILMCICFLLAYRKKYYRLLAGLSVVFLFLYGTALHKSADKMLDTTFYETVTDDDIRQAVEELTEEDDGYYRIEQSGTYSEDAANLNRIWNIGQYSSSVYSSSYNGEYQDFRKKTFLLEQPFRNILMQSTAKNPIFRKLMGVKYIISQNDIPGYELYKTVGDVNIYQKKEVLPVVYVTDRVMSQEQYDDLEFPYNQTALLDYAVVGNTNGGEEASPEKAEGEVSEIEFSLPERSEEGAFIEKKDAGYHICMEQIKNLKVEIGDIGESDTLFLQFDIKNNKKSKDVSMWLEGVKNKLTAGSHIYYNENETFTYAVNLKEGQKEVNLGLGAGDYEIQNIRCFVGKQDTAEGKLCQSEFQLDRELTKGNRLAGEVTAENEGYLITSIPYDDHFEVIVDGESVAYEKVNTAFLGCGLEEGTHEIQLVYHAPGLQLGKCLSLIGIIMFFLLDKRRCLGYYFKRIQKK